MPTSQPIEPRKSKSNTAVTSITRPVDPEEFAIRFPRVEELLDQDQEWCEVNLDGSWERIQFHDYGRIYNIPGLYEALFYDALNCCSPKRVAKLLEEELEESDFPAGDLRVLDVGAGNGMMGERLMHMGAGHIVGMDILPEAQAAAARDRPGVYDDYLVTDLTALDGETRQRLESARFNCMTTVAALGFSDMPPRAFAAAYNLVAPEGWIAFNVKESFVKGSDDSGFSRLIRLMNEWELINAHVYRRYCHRLSMNREPLYYVAMVARKVRDIPEELLAPLD